MTPNYAVLEELAQFLEGDHPTAKLPEHHIFDMTKWFVRGRENLLNNYEREQVNGCSTAGCALGFAAELLPSFAARYRISENSWRGNLYFLDDGVMKEYESENENNIGDPLGISSQEFWYLFSESGVIYDRDSNGRRMPIYPRIFKHITDHSDEPETRPMLNQEARTDTARRVRKLIKELKKELKASML